jgi:hydroxymethylbilane synthase
MWQARHVAARLQALDPGLEVELAIIKTEGDVHSEVPFGAMPGKGFFVKEIESALLSGEIDLAVHSLKDLPSEFPDGLALAAVLERHDPRDAILSLSGFTLDELPQGTLVATGSPRRRAQLLHVRPDLGMSGIRGNVGTRIRKLREGRFGALVLALAGVERLGIASVPVVPVPISVCLPAVGQGALAVETRADDARARSLVSSLTDAATLRAVTAERAFLARLGGGCLAPATAFARTVDGRIVMESMVGDADGRRLLRDRIEGRAGDEIEMGEQLADRMLATGARPILEAARAAPREDAAH